MVKSASNGRLLGAARAFLQQYPETLAIVPGRLAGDFLAAGAAGIGGVRRATLTQWAASLARPAMAERGLTPLSSLGLEAVTARVAHAAGRAGLLKYFDPVAGLPGFARALARTLSELRLAGVIAQGDLGLLLDRYQEELAARSLADLAAIFALAEEPAERMGLPVLFLDVRLEGRAHKGFFERLAAGSPDVLMAVSPGIAQDWMAEDWGGVSEDLDTPAPASPIEHLRRYVFSPAPPPYSTQAGSAQEGFEIFSAPGEGLETAEIARRILALARKGIAFDQMAVLLRNPDRHQPVMEEALRRAGGAGVLQPGDGSAGSGGPGVFGPADVRGGEFIGIQLRGISFLRASAGGRTPGKVGRDGG